MTEVLSASLQVIQYICVWKKLNIIHWKKKLTSVVTIHFYCIEESSSNIIKNPFCVPWKNKGHNVLRKTWRWVNNGQDFISKFQSKTLKLHWDIKHKTLVCVASWKIQHSWIKPNRQFTCALVCFLLFSLFPPDLLSPTWSHFAIAPLQLELCLPGSDVCRCSYIISLWKFDWRNERSVRGDLERDC